VDVEDEVRARQVEQVGIAGDLVRVVAEALAAVVVARELRALEHRAPRAVEDDDALVEQLPQPRFAGSGLSAQSVLRTVAERARSVRSAGSLGVFSPGRQAAVKALQVHAE
jgi:hypothetical protein